MIDVNILLLPRSIIDTIAQTGESWGTLRLKVEQGVAVPTAMSIGTQGVRPVAGSWIRGHFTDHATTRAAAFWHRAEPGLAAEGRPLTLQGRLLPLERFHHEVRGRRMRAPRLVVTVEPEDGDEPVVACWSVRPNGAIWLPHEIVDDGADVLGPLADGWPLQRVAENRVCVVGAGSIGGAACEALAAYGIRHLTIVDPDVLVARNFARHRANRREHGRSKARAVADMLEARDPLVRVTPLALNVDRDADQLRPVIRDSDIVLVCSDGTRSRRVSMHLAFKASRPVVLACVQGGGVYGEILRLVPGRTGCLLCNRASLGGALEPEPYGLELDYDLPGEAGTPISAVTGDLWLIGALAAKTTVATLLGHTGDLTQRLAGDLAVIGLRPWLDAMPPFDEVSECGSVKWLPTAEPRANCPTCGHTARR